MSVDPTSAAEGSGRSHWIGNGSGLAKRPHRTRSANLLTQYSLLMFVAVATVSTGLSLGLSRIVQDHLVRMHASVYEDIIGTVFSTGSFQGADRPTATDIHRLDVIAALPNVMGTALWNVTGNLLYQSGTTPSFTPVDEALSRALSGSASYRHSGASMGSGESPDYSFYVPVKDKAGSVVAVFVARENDSRLHDDLSRADLGIVATVSGGGLLLYGALFGLYLSAYRKQRLTADRLRQTHDSVMFAMSSLSGLRDQETGGHLERTQEYVRTIGMGLSRRRRHSRYVDGEYVETLSKVAPLHDIGKVGIPDAILRKEGRLTDEEFDAMKLHTVLGADLLGEARRKLPFSSSLELAEEVARHHHERWDGSGYPDKLQGDSIPLSARIMAIADVYDALRSERCYKPGLPHGEAMNIIIRGAGSQFDPELVQILQGMQQRFEGIFESLSEAATPHPGIVAR